MLSATIFAELIRNRVIWDVTMYRSGDEVGTDPINRYIADGEVAVASLAPDLKALSGADHVSLRQLFLERRCTP